MKKSRISACLALLLLLIPAAGTGAQEVVNKAIESVGKQILVKDYEKAFSYALFLIKYYKSSPMTLEAVAACERAVEAYAGSLAEKGKWPEILKLETSIASAPASVREKAAAQSAAAKKELAKIEEDRKKKELEAERAAEAARQAEAEKARLAEIEARIQKEKQAERDKEEARKRERDEATARELALLAERTKAEEAQRAHIDRMLQESRNLELEKERLRESERRASEAKQRELESQRMSAENQFRAELGRIMERTSQSNTDTIKVVSNANFMVIIGLGILALFVIAGITLLVIVSLRQQRMQHEQFQSTLRAMQGMRSVQPIDTMIALPFTPQDVDSPRALPGANRLMLEAGPGSEQDEQKAEARAIKDLLEKCQSYGQEIDKATGRRNASRLVADLLYKISRHQGYSEQDSILHYAVGLVYDIGFLNIDPAILRADHITEDQFAVIKTHTSVGLNMVFFVNEKYRELFKDGVAKHHENIDGSGYPFGLKDGAIPYIARALRVVESYVALVSSREYRQIKDRDSAVRELYANVDQYDQEIVRALDAII